MSCPQCGTQAHRSHSHNLIEKLVTGLTPFRYYRCHDCGWRGRLWRPREKSTGGRLGVKAILGMIITIILTLVIIFYLAGTLSSPTPPPE